MPISRLLARMSSRTVNPLVWRMADRIRPFALVEHKGRRSGHTPRPSFAFMDPTGRTITVALTYGPDVDWLANVTATGGGRITQRHRIYELGPASPIEPEAAWGRLPVLIRLVLRALRVRHFVEFPVSG